MTRQEALRKVTAGMSEAVHWVTRIPLRTRLRVLDWQEQKADEKSEPMLIVLQKRQEDLISFYTHFEDLVEILCNACQYGGGDKFETAYQEERAWMQTHYFLLRPYVVAYLRMDAEDAEQGIALQGFAGDAFQTLFAASSLGALVQSDDGNMISRILRTREALNDYAEHLRQLIIREKACS